MGQRIKASYYCPIHNLFSVLCLSDPPRYVVCPTCLKPSELCSFSVTHVEDDGVSSDDWALFVEELLKLTQDPPTGALAKGGDVNGIGRRPKQAKVAPDERTQKVLDNHEMIERAKMEATLYHNELD